MPLLATASGQRWFDVAPAFRDHNEGNATEGVEGASETVRLRCENSLKLWFCGSESAGYDRGDGVVRGEDDPI